MIWLTVISVVFVILTSLLLQIIIQPVRRIAASTNQVSLGNMDAPEIVVRGSDEISILGDAFNRMRRSMVNAMKLLEQ